MLQGLRISCTAPAMGAFAGALDLLRPSSSSCAS